MRRFLSLCMLALGLGINAQTTVTIGSGASTAAAGSNGDPIYRSSSISSYHHSRSVQLLTTSDLSTAGVSSGAVINNVGYYKTTTFNVSGNNQWTLNVYLKNSSATALTSGTAWATMTSGATLFYTATINSTNNFPSAAGWVTFVNNSGNVFNYTGGAIEVYIDWVPTGTMTSPYTSGPFQWKYDTTSSTQAMGTSNTSAITTTAYTTLGRRYQTQLTYTSTPCAGTPAPGNTLSSATPATSCPGPSYSTTLSLQNSTSGSGVTYQWYKNNTAIAGATSSTYATTITAADTFYCDVTCSGSTTSSTPITVAAPMLGIVPSYTNTFSPFPGSCWTRVSGGSPATGLGTGTTNYWVEDGFLNVGTTGAIKMNLYSLNRAGWLISPAFDLSAGGYRVKFDYGATTYSGTASSPMGSDDVVQFVVSTDGGTTWTVLQTWDAANPASNTTNQYNLNLSAYTGTSTIFALFGNDGTVDNAEDYDFFIDNFIIETIPTCDIPLSLVSSNITTGTADVSWTAPTPAPANGYEIYYSTTNTAPTASTVLTATNSVTSTTTSAQITGLSSSTTYYFWVRSVCSATDKSNWSTSSGSFTTLCVGVSTISENFDTTSTTGSVLPNCWSKLLTGTTSNAYVQASSPMSAPNSLYIYGNSASDNVIVKLPSLNNLDSGNYAIKFKGRANFTAGGKIDVGYMTDPTNESTFVTLGTYTTTSTTVVDNYYLPITGVPAGVTTLALKHGGVPAYSILIDDLVYDLTSTLSVSDIASSTNATVKAYPNPFTDLLTISNIKNVKSIMISDMSGKILKTFAKPESTLRLADLSAGMYLVILNMNDGSKQTIKAVKK